MAIHATFEGEAIPVCGTGNFERSDLRSVEYVQEASEDDTGTVRGPDGSGVCWQCRSIVYIGP